MKDGAIMVLGYEGNPIYAEWQRGAGRVGSFMSDLSGKWSELPVCFSRLIWEICPSGEISCAVTV